MGVYLNLGPTLSTCVGPMDTSTPGGGPCKVMLGQERSGGGGHSRDAGRQTRGLQRVRWGEGGGVLKAQDRQGCSATCWPHLGAWPRDSPPGLC